MTSDIGESPMLTNLDQGTQDRGCGQGDGRAVSDGRATAGSIFACMRPASSKRAPLRSQGLLGWLLACPEKGFFVPIESEPTNSPFQEGTSASTGAAGTSTPAQ